MNLILSSLLSFILTFSFGVAASKTKSESKAQAHGAGHQETAMRHPTAMMLDALGAFCDGMMVRVDPSGKLALAADVERFDRKIFFNFDLKGAAIEASRKIVADKDFVALYYPGKFKISDAETSKIRESIGARDFERQAKLMLAVHNANKVVHYASNGLVKELKDILDEKVLADSFDHEGVSALDRALDNGGHDLIELLLVYGADPNQINKQTNKTMLMRASTASEIVKILLAYGADPLKGTSEFKDVYDCIREDERLIKDQLSLSKARGRADLTFFLGQLDLSREAIGKHLESRKHITVAAPSVDFSKEAAVAVVEAGKSQAKVRKAAKAKKKKQAQRQRNRAAAQAPNLASLPKIAEEIAALEIERKTADMCAENMKHALRSDEKSGDEVFLKAQELRRALLVLQKRALEVYMARRGDEVARGLIRKSFFEAVQPHWYAIWEFERKTKRKLT
jgi:hypothetical protein